MSQTMDEGSDERLLKVKVKVQQHRRNPRGVEGRAVFSLAISIRM